MMRGARILGFSLVEVTLALGIAAICLLSVIALLPIGTKANQAATNEAAAASILSAVIADMRATPVPTPPAPSSVTSTQFGIPIPTDSKTPPEPPAPGQPSPTPVVTLYFDSEGAPSTLLNSRYRLGVWFWKNSQGANAAAFAELKASWPSPVDPLIASPAGSVGTWTAIDRH